MDCRGRSVGERVAYIFRCVGIEAWVLDGMERR